MVVIIDYGIGNIASIKNMLKRLGIASTISSSSADILHAKKIILPGVGSFDTCARNLYESKLIDILHKKVFLDKTPILGICVGMQLFFEKSEEGIMPGLGWIKGDVVKFDFKTNSPEYKIPHMGWSSVDIKKSSYLVDHMYNNPKFYFVHSYHARLSNNEDCLFTAEYGYTFTAGICKDNIIGVQFHPEKSHKYGMRLLENFARNIHEA